MSKVSVGEATTKPKLKLATKDHENPRPPNYNSTEVTGR